MLTIVIKYVILLFHRLAPLIDSCLAASRGHGSQVVKLFKESHLTVLMPLSGNSTKCSRVRNCKLKEIQCISTH